MKSVGVVCDNFLAPLQHEDRLVELSHEVVETPGKYERLIQFVEEFNESCSDAVPVVLEVKPNAVGTMYDLFKSQGMTMLFS